jgi:heme oxygenase
MTTSFPARVRPAPLIDTVRRVTRPLHDRVEQAFAATDTAWTTARYARLLRVTYAVVAPLERAVQDRLGALFAAPPPSTRAERIEGDLAALGEAPPPTQDALTTASDADALGVGYVLQGSLLGGAVIARQVRAACDPKIVQMRYVEMYGAALPSVWRQYCAALNDFGLRATDEERHRVVDAATRTFAMYDAALMVIP